MLALSRSATAAGLIFALHGGATHLPYCALPVSWRVDLWLDRYVSDKLLHFTAYAGLTTVVLIVFMRFIGRRRNVGAKTGTLPTAVIMALICGLMMITGLVDEVTQPFVGRHFDWLDWAADVAGIATAGTFTSFASIVKPRWALLS